MPKLAVVSYFLICLAYMPGCADKELQSDLPVQQNFIRRNENELQIASKIYASESNPKLKIRLLGVTHIGELQYFQHIQNMLDQSNTVLYEGQIVEWQHSPDLRCRQRSYIDPQAGMSLLVGLVHQKDVLKYDGSKSYNIDYPIAKAFKNFGQNADCEASLRYFLSKLIERRPELSIDALFALEEDSFKKTVDPRDLLAPGSISRKFLIEQALLGSSIMPAEYRRTLVDRRDRKALKGIKQHMSDTGTTTVIYGASHMAGIEAGLLDMGYLLESQEWLTAFRM